jgi:tetratricopeptide (TPR) repeat protein
MAYNKSKFVETAQKLLNQGKVAQAIAEYQQILKHEPRDQVTLMTIGELYIRQGETFQAIDYFERLAQLFVGDGFLTKAIAVYKRIAKLAPEEIRPLEKLADLYVQQGVMSEARPLFLQLAEMHLKNNRQPEAVALLKKLLAAEPDNLRIQIRLADLYQAMGQNKEAIDAYISAAQRALARGDQAECEKLADKTLKLDANNLPAIIVKARVYSTQANFTQAAQLLERVPDLEKGGEQAELLLDVYLKNVKWDQAAELALRIFDADPKNFGPAQKLVEALLESGQGDRAMSVLDRTRIPMIDAGEHEVVGKLLNDLAERLPGRIEPLEWLVETYGRTSDSFRLPDALAHLGDALVAANKLERAKQVFEQLVDREPESEPAKRKLNDVLRRMGTLSAGEPTGIIEQQAPVELVKPAAPKVRPDLEPAPPEVKAQPAAPVTVAAVHAAVAPALPPPPKAEIEPALDDETQKFIAQSLTDVDLFASYGLTQKAIGLLEAILRRAPRHVPTLEKLLDFVLGAGDDRRTAELAAQLEQIHIERGDPRGSERFGELRRRFQRAAGLTDEELAPAAQAVALASAPAVPEVKATPEVAAEPPAAELPVEQAPVVEAAEVSAPQAEPVPQRTETVHEVDLSDEWAAMLDSAQAGAPAPAGDAASPPAESGAEFEIPAEPAGDQEGTQEFVISDELMNAPAAAAFEVPTEAPPPAFEDETPAFAHASTEAPASTPPASTAHEEAYELPEISEEPAAPAFAESPEPVPQAALPEVPVAPPPAEVAAAPPAPPRVSQPELELDQDYELVLDPEPLIPAWDQKPPEPAHLPSEPVAKDAASSGFASDQFLSDLANEIDSLGIGELTPGYSQPAAPETAETKDEKPLAPIEVGPLKEVFEEFRAELGEMGGEEEDLETHYNLGIAFREMGLLEEAISEFQKVAKASERGRPFRYSMQCFTLLGLTFMDRGQPSIAAMWYERALHLPGIEPESELALRYDLGVAQESAGEIEAALKSFFQVYAVNIDYRDVGERIAALQKPAR